MAIQSFGVSGPYRPGYAQQNKTQKTTRYSPPGKKYITSYREDFRNWEIPKKESFKPADNLIRSDAKFQAISSYQADYGWKASTGTQVPEPQSLHGALLHGLDCAMKPTQPSKLQRATYAPNTAVPLGGDLGSAPRRPKVEDPSSAPPPKTTGAVVGGAARQAFAHSTEYKDNFRAWPVPPVYQRAYPPYDPPKGTMQFVTSYAWDYRPWGDQTRSTILQREEFNRPKGPFQHTTTYLAEYTSKVATPTRTRPAQKR